MAQRTKLTRTEIDRPFEGEIGTMYPVILSPQQLADLLGLSVKTVYLWIADGRFDGCFRKCGKHILIWRHLALDRIFNGPSWNRE